MKSIEHIGQGVFNLISWFDLEKVGNAKVLVVGAGALGNEVLKDMALLGIGNIVIVDFDNIEKVNLCRSVLFRGSDVAENKFKSEVAAMRVNELNPGINVTWLNGDIEKEVGLGFFHDADVIIGCLDNMLARYFVNKYSFLFKKSWVDAGIENLEGNASVYEFDKSCFACSLSDNAMQNLSYRLGCPDVVQYSYQYGRVATTPLSSSILAAIQVQEALKIIHGYRDGMMLSSNSLCRTLSGKIFRYDGVSLDQFIMPFEFYMPECSHHEAWENVVSDERFHSELTVEEFLSTAENVIQKKIKGFYNRNPFVSHVVIDPVDRKIEVMLPVSKLQNFLYENNIFPAEGQKIVIHPSPSGGYTWVDKNFPWMNFTLSKLGVPKYDIIRVTDTEMKDHFILLTGDRNS